MTQYYVQWRSATDPTRVFYKSFPPRMMMQPTNLDRYSIEPRNLSLYIHDITPADEADQYVCLLGVEDTLPNIGNRELPFTMTESVNLSVSIFCEFGRKWGGGGGESLSRT